VVTLNNAASAVFAFGYFKIMMDPSQVLATNSGWNILQLTDTTYFNDDSAVYGLPAGSFTLTFRPVPGFITPPNRALTVTANQTNLLTVIYTNLVPQDPVSSFSNAAFRLAFTAPTGQRYALERSTNLLDWVTLVTNQVPSGGTLRYTNSGLGNVPKAYYRARFVP
jgi:hypothetical protein